MTLIRTLSENLVYLEDLDLSANIANGATIKLNANMTFKLITSVTGEGQMGWGMTALNRDFAPFDGIVTLNSAHVEFYGKLGEDSEVFKRIKEASDAVQQESSTNFGFQQ